MTLSEQAARSGSAICHTNADRCRFSVVIPTYNVAPYLNATLKSLALQSYRDFEAVVVDDGSQDESVAIARQAIRDYQLNGVILERAEGDAKGVSTCRNLGIARANGDWIAFLDGDDLFHADKLQMVSSAIDQFGAVAKAFYHRSRRIADRSGEVLGEVGPRTMENDPRWILDDLLEGKPYATSATVVSRELLLELGGFDSRLNGVEDWWLDVRIARRSPWVLVAGALGDLRVRERSLMTNQHFRHYVEQHVALLQVAAGSGELTVAQLDMLRRYVLGPLTSYFASSGFARGGWKELAPALMLLATSGYPETAWRIAYRQMRARVLARALHVVRS